MVARWADLGITVDLVTFGGLPPGRTGCDEPRSIHVNWVRVTGRSWFTSLGLRVGDPTSKLRRLYPRAQRNPRGTWPRPSAHWLVTRRAACIGICSTDFVTVPQLLAEVRNGRVIAFFFHVGAEGDQSVAADRPRTSAIGDAARAAARHPGRRGPLLRVGCPVRLRS